MTCRGSNWVATDHGDTWYLTVHQNAAEAKACPLEFITMKKLDTKDPQTDWIISSYRSEEAFHKAVSSAGLSCYEQY